LNDSIKELPLRYFTKNLPLRYFTKNLPLRYLIISAVVLFIYTFSYTECHGAEDYDIVIKGGTIVTAQTSFVADIGIGNGKILKIAKNGIVAGSAEVIYGAGKYVLPGAIDAHVHMNLKFCGSNSEDWDTSTAAAACGGVTTIIDFAIQTKGQTLASAIKARMADARNKVCIDFALHGGITDWNERTKKEMRHFTKNGIPSFKMFMIYKSQGWMADDAMLFEALEQTKETGALILLHAESEPLLALFQKQYKTDKMMKKHKAYCHSLARPEITETEAINRACFLTKTTGGRAYIVHVSSAEGSKIIGRAAKAGTHIWGETCPQYLLLDDSVFKRSDGHLFATCPQIKKLKDKEGLLQSVKNGVLTVLSTDTCTFSKKQKASWNGDFTKIPYGMPGVETLLPTMHTLLVKKSRCSMNQLVALTSTNPAKLFGMYPQKGAIEKGSDADLVVFDPMAEQTIDIGTLKSTCDWNPYEGMKLQGLPVVTISRGRIVARKGKFMGKKGWGRFVHRKPGGSI